VQCLISGLFFFWDFARRWSDRKERRSMCHSIKSGQKFDLELLAVYWVFGNCRIVPVIQRNPTRLKVIIPAVLAAVVILDQMGLRVREAVTQILAGHAA
jgi:hypothetical protein